MANKPVTGPGFRGYRQLILPNKHPEGARASGQKPAGRALMVPIGNGTYVMPTGGSRAKP